MKRGSKIIAKVLLAGMCLISITLNAQKTNSGKKISSDLFGLFFEDINYAADGGLYAELVQNRSFVCTLVLKSVIAHAPENNYLFLFYLTYQKVRDR